MITVNEPSVIPVNKFQTPLTQSLLDSLPQEVREQLIDFVTNVQFIKNLISPDRPYYKDLPKDERGAAIVDITNPPIMTDADYFRQPALHYLEHKCYTFLRPNNNPNSEFRKFWDEERRRCWEGLIREDGAWISGFNYWFLNYQPMMINKIIEGRKKAVRVEEFPYFNEGNVWRYYYLYNARENGHHAIELARRGAHPYFQKVFTPEGWKLWEDIKIGDELYGTYGNITKVIDIPYDKEAPYYKITFRDGRVVYASDDHMWKVKIHNHKNLELHTTKELLNIYKRKRKVSWRLPKGIEYIVQVLKGQGIEYTSKETAVDPYTFGVLLGDGCFRHKSCCMTQSYEDMCEISKHIPYEIVKWGDKYTYMIKIPKWTSILKKYGLYWAKSEDKFIPDEFKYNSKEIRLNILKGLMDTDGMSQIGRAPTFTTVSKRLADDVLEIVRSLGYNGSYVICKTAYKKDGITIPCLSAYIVTIYGGKEIFNLPRKQFTAIYRNNSRCNGTVIVDIAYMGTTKCKCVEVDSEDKCYLIGDFVPTHNCSKSYSLSSIMGHNLILGENEQSRRRVITILTAYQKEYLSDSKDGTLAKFKPAINFSFINTPFPHLLLKNSPNEMTWQMGYKDELGREQGSFNLVSAVSSKDDSEKLRGKRGWILFEEIGTFRGLLNLYDTTRKSVEDGDYTFACMYLVGTSGDKDSDFSAAKQLLYSTKSYNIETLDNVYDKPRQGSPTFGYFFPAYINRLGCYNNDGVSDVTKALIEVLLGRYKVKYGANPTSLLKFIAEDPITPAEAIIKARNAFFPVPQINERIQQLDADPKAFDDVYVGTLTQQSNGEVVFTTTSTPPIRKYGVSNDTPGALEIFEMPQRNSYGEISSNRYIIGHDPVNNDQADSSSLSSTFVLDLFTDRIVAEFTGRSTFADDSYEMVRLLCLYYNALCLYESNIKGLFAYFKRMNCTHLLADTPQYLRDKQIIKYSSFGSSSKGVAATAAVNNYANGLIRDWLLKPITNIVTQDGEDTEVTVPNLSFIRNRALLEELSNYDAIRNFDRVRALGILMLYREEKVILYGGKIDENSDRKSTISALANDDYFTRNYDNRVKAKL